MNTPRPTPWWFFACTLAMGILLSAGLITAWTRDPSNRFGGMAFAIWVAGCTFLAWYSRPLPARTGVWVASLALLVLGELGTFQAIKHAALALLLPSLCRRPLAFGCMAIAAASWTPAWGWVFSHSIGTPLDMMRPLFVLACFAAARLA